MSNDDSDPLLIRPAIAADAPALGRLGALLLETHFAFDPQRFLAPGEDPQAAYAVFLRTQMEQAGVVLLVAERAGSVVGYVYAGLEPHSWKELRAAAAFIHDVVVDESSRGAGVATQLLEVALQRLKELGAPRVLLWTAELNSRAQRLFAELGFRRTMVEMTREL